MQCFQNSQVERIRARHDGNEQAVEMCKVEMRMVHMLVEMGVVEVMIEIRVVESILVNMLWR